RAVHHHDLLGRAADAARVREVDGHGLAERSITGRIAVGGKLLRAVADLPRGEAPPDLTRKAVPIGAAGPKIVRKGAVALGDTSIGAPDEPVDVGHARAPRR